MTDIEKEVQRLRRQGVPERDIAEVVDRMLRIDNIFTWVWLG